VSTRNGYVLAEFIKANEGAASDKPKYDYEGKKAMFLFPSEIGVLLALPTPHPGIICNKSLTNPDVKKLITIERVEENHELTYIEMNKETVMASITVNLKPSDLAVVQSLLKFCLPHLMGWNYLSDMDAVERNLPDDNANTHMPLSPFKEPKNS
jgi:hypothetical protein